jgi:gliding motility-associated-like protein
MNRQNIGQGNTSQDFLAMPATVIPANGQLKFATRSYTPGDLGTKYQIWVKLASAGPQNVTTGYTLFQQWDENNLTAVYNICDEKTVDLYTSYANMNVYVAFVMEFTQTTTGISGDRWLVDNVRIVDKCLEPTTLPTTPILYNQATLHWANPGGATSFEIENILGTGAPTGTATGTSTTNSYVQTGLTALTAYNYYVRAHCANGEYSAWVGPFSYTTTAAPPICGGNFLDSGGLAGSYSNNENITTTVTADTPTNLVTVTFTSFGTENCCDHLSIYDGCSVATGTLLGTFQGTAIPPAFTSSTPGGCLTFVFTSDGSVTGTGWISNITCSPAPTCTKPVSLTATALSTTATLNWNQLPNPNSTVANSWEVIALPCGSPAPTATSVGVTANTSTSFVMIGLTPSTCYNFYVRAVCSSSDSSPWSALATATTQALPPVCGGNFVDNGGASANYANNSNDTVTICPVSPGDKVTVTFTAFDTEVNFNGIGYDGLYVYDGNSIAASQISSGNPIGVGFPAVLTTPGAYWGTTIPGPFTSTSADGCLTFVFRSDTSGQRAGWTSNVTCALPPTCTKPVSLTATALSTTATLNWNQLPNPNSTVANSWEVIALPCGSPAPTATSVGVTANTSISFVMIGLTPSTCYNFYVRAICSATDSSPWSALATATTQTLPPVCGGNFVDNGGSSASYANNSNDTITICPVNPGDLVTVAFTTFDTESTWDGLYVYDGSTVNASTLIASTNPAGNVPGGLAGSYWGTTIPGPFTSSSADGCLTFVFRSDGLVSHAGWISNITCSPPPSCRKPSVLTTANITTTSAQLGFTQLANPNGSIASNWEYLIVPAGSPAPTASMVGTAISLNLFTASGLTPATCYDYYVRAICSSSDFSYWSGPKSFCTIIQNDECANATVVLTNPDQSCTNIASGSLIGATGSPQANACTGNANDDVWFQFVATSSSHSIGLTNISSNAFNLYHALYQGVDCSSLTQVYCSTNNTSTASGLIVGQTYYIRVYSFDNTPQTTTFNVCVGTIPPPITTASTIGGLTPEQIVQNVLLNSTCASVSNVTYSTSTNFGFAESGIGTFNQNGSTFPFSDGVILSTGFVGSAAGPNTTNQSNGGFGGGTWPGDADLEATLAAAGIPTTTLNATKLEFDFTPITNQINFDFIFASEEYGTFQCTFSDAFAFLLTDITTGITTNLAIVPGTTTPISVVTIRDELYNNSCASVNPQYFAQYNQLPGVSPLGSPTNFNGQTVPLTATAPVTINAPYHIKLVIADRSDTAYDSAVFLKGSSFGIGNLNLGNSLLQSTGNAVCFGGTQVLNCGLDPTLYTFSWLQDGVLMVGQTGASLTVNQAGTYTIQASYNGSSCSGTDSVIVEFYPEITNGTPNDLGFCSATGTGVFDLTQNTPVILAPLVSGYTVNYYTSSADANSNTNPIANPSAYTNVSNPQTICARVQNLASGCFKVVCFNLNVQNLTPIFTVPSTLSLCLGTSGTIAVNPVNFNPTAVTYSWTLNGNVLPDTTSSISVTLAGDYQVTVNNSGCTSSQVTTVTVGSITADVSPNIITCGSYVLPALSTNNNYYDGQDGTGIAHFAGDIITVSQQMHIYAQSGTCNDDSNFDITIIPVELPIFSQIPNICLNAVAPILPVSSNNGVPITGTWNAPIDTSIVGTIAYTFTPTSGQCAATTTMNITIDAPVTPTFVQIPNICQNSTAPVLPTTSSNLIGITGTWDATINTAVVGTVLYTFTPASGQCAVSTTMSVTIVPLIASTFVQIPNICQNSVAPLLPNSSSNNPSISGTWSPATINTSVPGSAVYTFTPTFGQCATTTTMTIVIDLKRTPDFASIPAICSGSLPIQSLATTSPNLISGTWTPPTISNIASGSYLFTPNANQCANTQTVTVTVIPLFSAVLSGNCQAGAFVLTAEPANGSFNASSASYSWTSTGGYTSNLQSPTITVAGTYNLTITTLDGCQFTDNITIPNTVCTIQKGISPNGDEFNQAFDLSGFDVQHLDIYNRYGTKVYSKSNYKKEWTGQTDAGAELPDGTYYYVIELGGGDSKSGWIYINR